jgi:hypothetical protein
MAHLVRRVYEGSGLEPNSLLINWEYDDMGTFRGHTSLLRVLNCEIIPSIQYIYIYASYSFPLLGAICRY